MVKKIVPIMLLLVLLTGCMNIKPRVLDDVQLGTGGGYEYLDDEKLEITVVYPNFQPDKSVKNETITASSVLSKEVRDLHNFQSDKQFVSGKVEVALYERKIAENGIIGLLDTLQRDPSIGSNIYLAILEGSPKEILSKQYGNLDNGIYLSNLIEQNIEKGLIHKTNLHQFFYKFYADGIDPMLPIFNTKNGRINLKAIGLFDDDKLIDEIESGHFYMIKILLEPKSEQDAYYFKINEDKYISIMNINASRKYDIPEPMTSSEIKINIKIKAAIREDVDGLLDNQNTKGIERIMEKEIKKKTEELIKRFQKLGIDPLGVGEEVRTRTRKWDKEKWDDLYPNIKITVSSEVNIRGTGVVK